MSGGRGGESSSSLGRGSFDGVMDSYDMIDAPQFVDFDDLRLGLLDDKEEADEFFNVHREEDDFYVPAENLTPSIQFLNETNDNKKVQAATSVSPDKILKSSSQIRNTSTGIPIPSNIKPIIMDADAIPVHQIYNHEDEENNENCFGKENANPCNQRKSSSAVQQIVKVVSENQQLQGSPNESCLRDSLVAQLENFHLNTSDNSCKEEEVEVEVAAVTLSDSDATTSINDGRIEVEIINSNSSEITVKDVSVEIEIENEKENMPKATPDQVDGDYSKIFAPIPTRHSQEPKSKELALDMREIDERPYSMYIAPTSVGLEVQWNEDDGIKAGDISISTEKPEEPIEEPAECFFDFESHILSAATTTHESPLKKNTRRASSCSDLVKLIVPVERNVNVYGYIPHVGITIPKTPDKATAHKMLSEARVEKYSPSRRRIHSSTSNLAVKGPKAPPSAAPKVGLNRNQGQGKFFTDSARLSRAPVKQDRYVSLAEAVNQFQQGTPDRFHTKSRTHVPPRAVSASGNRSGGSGRRMPSPSPVRNKNKKSVDSSTMNTSTDSVASFKSETDNNLSGKSGKAGPPGMHFKPAVFNLPKKFESKATVPKPFNFHETRKRAIVAAPEPEKFTFKARPVPLKIFHGPGPAGLKEKVEMKATSPKELHFASEDRIRERNQRKSIAPAATTSPSGQSSREPQRRPANASKIPTPGRPMPELISHKSTAVRPFSFEDRDKEAYRRKQEKLHRELEEQKKIKEFRANPLPNFAKCGLPKKKPVEVTDLAPFNLKSEERGVLYRQNWKSKLESEMKELEENRKFHANPPSVIYKEPFRPDYSSRPLVEPIEPNLNTDRRAHEREKYEEELRQKQELEEMQRREMEILQAEREREEEIERRRQLVHKALPLKILPPFQVKSSDKPLTEPQSPAFTRLPSERRVFK